MSYRNPRQQGRGNQGRNPTDQYQPYKEVSEKYKEILDGNGKMIVEIAEKIAKITTGERKVTTNQIRKIFGDLKRKQYKEFNIHKIQLIRPKLAYTYSRHKSKGMGVLLGSVDFLIEKIKEEKQFNNLVNFFESIIAYHKRYGGK
ncbi:MAG: type III-A CRISPR-associated protein Csm2 [Promethearchaeota archaeon]